MELIRRSMEMIELKNEVLKKITKQIYETRTSLDIKEKVFCRYEKVQDGVFAEIWFMTEGCKHDRSGGCTMCNYGKGYVVEDQEIIKLIDDKLTEINMPLKQLVISPTGSMFDEEEVSEHLRNEIFRLAGKFQCEKFITETRADTITAEKLYKMKEWFPHRNIAIELGLESATPWILKNCINKDMELETFKKAVRLIKEAGLLVTANIALGIPFLSEKAQIEDTKKTMRWALDIGVDTVVVFPIHVKPGTLVHCLYENGLYQCVSLWSLVEVLKSIHVQEREKVQISWYKNYYSNPKKIVNSPTTCNQCYANVIHLLDQYKNSCSMDIVSQLDQYSCDCKKEYMDRLQRYKKEDETDYIYKCYRKLCEIFNIDTLLVEKFLKEGDSDDIS